jgi:hypothetical protein
MMEAAKTTERLVNFNQTTRRNNPEGSRLYTRHCEELNFHDFFREQQPDLSE